MRRDGLEPGRRRGNDLIAAQYRLLVRSTGLPVGRLAGQIRIERENVSCYVPIATMILVSLLLTVLLNIVIRLLNR